MLPAQKLGKTSDGDDGRLELMGKVVDKIRSEHLRIFQLLRHFVEALGQGQQVGVLAQPEARLDPGVEIAAGQTVHALHQPQDGPEGHLAGQPGDHGAEDHADARHDGAGDPDDGDHFLGGGDDVASHHEEGHHRRRDHRHRQSAEHNGRKEEGQAENGLGQISFHTFFTAL